MTVVNRMVDARRCNVFDVLRRVRNSRIIIIIIIINGESLSHRAHTFVCVQHDERITECVAPVLLRKLTLVQLVGVCGHPSPRCRVSK